MPDGPASGNSGRDEDPTRGPGAPGSQRPYEPTGWRRVPDRPERPDIPEEVLAAWLEAEAEEGDPEDWEEYAGTDNEEDPEEIAADARQASREQAEAAERLARAGLAAALAAAGAERRGPGMPGSAQVFAGDHVGPAALFAAGMLFDTMPGRLELAAFADEAAGPGDSYESASDDELVGVLSAWDRVEAHAAARKHAAAAELIR